MIAHKRTRSCLCVFIIRAQNLYTIQRPAHDATLRVLANSAPWEFITTKDRSKNVLNAFNDQAILNRLFSMRDKQKELKCELVSSIRLYDINIYSARQSALCYAHFGLFVYIVTHIMCIIEICTSYVIHTPLNILVNLYVSKIETEKYIFE